MFENKRDDIIIIINTHIILLCTCNTRRMKIKFEAYTAAPALYYYTTIDN